MESILNILKSIWTTLRRIRARLLARMYSRCRGHYECIYGRNKCSIDDYSEYIENYCSKARISIPESPSSLHINNLLRKYISWRYSWSIRCTIYTGKLAGKRMCINNSKDLYELLKYWGYMSEKSGSSQTTINDAFNRQTEQANQGITDLRHNTAKRHITNSNLERMIGGGTRQRKVLVSTPSLITDHNIQSDEITNNMEGTPEKKQEPITKIEGAIIDYSF